MCAADFTAALGGPQWPRIFNRPPPAEAAEVEVEVAAIRDTRDAARLAYRRYDSEAAAGVGYPYLVAEAEPAGRSRSLR